MIYQLLVVTLVLLGITRNVDGSKLVHDQIEVYRRIIQEGFGEEMVSASSLMRLMQLTEGNPKYNQEAMKQAISILGTDTPVPFARLHEIADKIYGDQISDDPFQPQEVHLAITSDISEMKAMWVTMDLLEKPVVQYQSTASENDADWSTASSAEAVSFTYRVEQKWWPIFTGWIYEVDMTHLTPSMQYRYRVGGYDTANATMRYSQEYRFRAAPRPNNPSHTTKAFTLADHGSFLLLGFETVWKMQKLMDSYRPDFVFVAGDLSYAGLSSAMPRLNISKDDEFELLWDLLGIQNEPIAARIPWMVGNGNHERFYNWTAYTNRYKMPQTPSLASVGNFWYTFTYGNIQWIQISSEHSLEAGSDQMVFLQKALAAAAANRAVVPWIVVTLHKPLYCSVLGSPSFAALLEETMMDFDVDLVITGHMHAYERVHPVYHGAVTSLPNKEWMMNMDTKKPAHCDVYRNTGAGPVQIMQGHAGGMQAERFQQPSPAWSAFRMADGVVIGNRSRDESSLGKWQDAHKSVEIDLTDDSVMTTETIMDLPLIDAGDRTDLPYNYSTTYGFGYITAVNATHLHYQAIPNVEGLRNHDEFWIVKDHSPKTVAV
jgi:acid phosphatase type 7